MSGINEAKQRIQQAIQDLEPRLDLGGLNLASLPIEIGEADHLTHLTLRANSMEQLPAEIGHLINLKQLSVPDNRLSKLPDDIGKLTSLTRLNLRNNQIVELPLPLLDLENLELLRLDGNKLPIPRDIIAKWDRPKEIIAYYREHCVVQPEPKPPTLSEMVHKMFDQQALDQLIASLAIPEAEMTGESTEELAGQLVQYHQTHGLEADLIELLDIFRPGHFAEVEFSPEADAEESI